MHHGVQQGGNSTMTIHGGMGLCIATKMLAQFAAIIVFSRLMGGPSASPSGLVVIVMVPITTRFNPTVASI